MDKTTITNLFDIKGKTALITGATGGLGKAVSLGLSAAGAKLVITGRSKEKLEPLAKEIAANGGDVFSIAGEPTNHDDVIKIIAGAKEAFGRIDILVTAAGYNKVGPITEQPLEEWEQIMDANVKGTYLFCKGSY